LDASSDAFRFGDAFVDVFNSESGQPMPLTNDVRDEIKAAKKLRMPGWAVVCDYCLFPMRSAI
jgi:hypothetical protein